MEEYTSGVNRSYSNSSMSETYPPGYCTSGDGGKPETGQMVDHSAVVSRTNR
jgi:hypothetical protein